MRLRGFAPFVICSALIACSVLCAIAGCGGPSECSPACTTGMRCDPETVTCVPDGDARDLGSQADLLAGCSPACNKPLVCGPNRKCVVCVTDADCPLGSVCKTGATGAACVLGCTDDSRCPKGTGGVTLSCCGGQCTDTTTDAENCGACGTACTATHASPVCQAGHCGAGTCSTGWGDCNQMSSDGCEANLRVDTANCGTCGSACQVDHAIAGCAGACYIKACAFGWDDCNGKSDDGCETSVDSDPKNCGACNRLCSNPPHGKASCGGAACLISSCDAGYADCNLMGSDGCEVAVATDAKNCGGCGKACLAGQVCTNGMCTCPVCNFPNATSACVNGQCMLTGCVTGYADCDGSPTNGCESFLNGDPKNCSRCGNVCPAGTPSCSSGSCSTINNRVMVLYAVPNQAWAGEVQQGLVNTGMFSAVDAMNVGAMTPTLGQLQGYGAVLVFSDATFQNATGLGDVLADFFDTGGQVVVAPFATVASLGLKGRFGDPANGYMWFSPGGQEGGADSLGKIREPSSPLVAGVNMLSTQQAFRTNGPLANGATIVAEWASGKPLIVRGVIKGRNRADVNLYPPSFNARSDFWTGDGSRILGNALLFR